MSNSFSMFFANEKWAAMLRIALGAIILHAGFGEFIYTALGSGVSNTFVSAADPQALSRAYILSTLIPNLDVLGAIVAWGEVAVGLSLLLGLFTPLGILAAAFMGVNFYFSGAWTSSAAQVFNLVLVVACVEIFLHRAGGVWGFDSLIAARFPKLRFWLVNGARTA